MKKKYSVVSIIIISLFFLSIAKIKTFADENKQESAMIAKITAIIGKRELWLNLGGRRSPGAEGAKLQKYRDKMIVSGNSSTHAILNFFSKDNKDLGMYVKTNPHQIGAIYYFPCILKGGQFLFGWKLAHEWQKPCHRGVKIKKGEPQLSSLKQLYSQSAPRKINYCVTETESGNSFLGVTSGDPCKKAVAQCKKNNKSDRCTPTTVGHWWNTEPNLTAIIRCDDRSELFRLEGSGAKMQQLVKQLWQQTNDRQAKSCGLEIYSPEDIYVSPAETIETKDEEIMVKTEDTGACPEVKVVYGAVIVKSASNPQGELLKAEDKSINNFCQTNQDKIKTEFDLEKERKSIDVEILLADREGLAFCSEQQVSGGTEGDERTIQLTAKQGTVKLNYEMFDVPDRIEIFQGEKLVYQSDGFVSGYHSESITLNGDSGRLRVKLTGNEIPSTLWNYTLECPRIRF